MKFFAWPAVLAAALFSGAVVIPFEPWSTDKTTQFALEATVTSSVGGEIELYYDSGEGFSHAASVRVPLVADTRPQVYRLRIPDGVYRQFRFDPNDRTAVVTIANVRVIGGTNRVIRAIDPSEFKAAHQISSLQATPEKVVVEVAPGADDPQLLLDFAPPLELRLPRSDKVKAFARSVLLPGFVVFGITLGMLALLAASTRARKMLAASSDWAHRHPGCAVAVMALLAVSASDYPIVFLGKSYVSPNLGALLLYETYPTVPGSANSNVAALNGADIAAAVWQHLPMSMVQHRALLQDGELPLWNRYNSCGTLLLGQGQSMFGDPLHSILLLADGAAWAWDLKYVIAKWIFATALGLTVLTITRHLPASLIVSLAAPFMGFFVYRFNHPAFVSFCYAPAVLYCWARIADAKPLRVAALWTALLILGNLALMNSGTVKEAYVLLVCMNFSGVCLLLGSPDSWPSRLLRLAMAVWAGVIFALLSAPVWLTFLDSLQIAYTSYDNPDAFQIQPSLLIGLFDEIFYRSLTDGKFVFNPSANFLVCGGVLYFLATLRCTSQRILSLGLSALVPLSVAFGFVPAGMITRLPFFGNIVHVDNSFSCALIVLLGILAGAGFKNAAERLGTDKGKADLLSAGLLLFALVFGFVAFRQAVHRQALGNTFSPIHSGREITVDPFTWYYLLAILLALISLATVARRALRRGQVTAPGGLLIILCTLVLLWRLGLHAEVLGPSFRPYVIQPTERADLHEITPSIKFVQKGQAREPSRVFGIASNLSPGWSATYGLESVNGPDGLINPFYRELTTLPNTGLEQFWGWRIYLRPDRVAQSQRFLDFLNVRYYLGSTHGVPPTANLLKLVKQADLNVYESASTWPRAFFTDRLSSYEKPEDLLKTILAEGSRPFASYLRKDPTSAMARAELPGLLEGREVVAAQDYSLSSNKTSFLIKVNRPGIIVLSEAYWPGESFAELNGKSVPVMRVNHIFQGVFVDTPGEYRVAFNYRPRRFSTSLLCCAIGVIFLFISLSFAWKIDRSCDLSTIGHCPDPV
jgi:hypothetical protein